MTALTKTTQTLTHTHTHTRTCLYHSSQMINDFLISTEVFPGGVGTLLWLMCAGQRVFQIFFYFICFDKLQAKHMLQNCAFNYNIECIRLCERIQSKKIIEQFISVKYRKDEGTTRFLILVNVMLNCIRYNFSPRISHVLNLQGRHGCREISFASCQVRVYT